MRERAALYARFSTELQSDRSIEDQFALCQGFAEKQGYQVTDQYSDRARSGTTTHGRDGLQRLLEDARRGQFTTVVVESLDRLSRDTEDLAGLYKRLSFAGISIVAVHDGMADAVQIGLRGLMSSIFLTDLKNKTRRGLAGVVRDGRHAGGRAYGYSTTPGQPGVLRINEAEATVVRRIFREYLAGEAPRMIVKRLNDEGVPAPRGARWVASTINGNMQRGHGILPNALYGGRIIWNKTRMVRDPDTGKRIARANPEAEWQISEVPELALIPPEQWIAAQQAKNLRGHDANTRPDSRHKRLLSGLLKCSCCGGGMAIHDRRGSAVRVKCSTFRESGSCSNNKSYRLDKIEKAVIDGLLDRMRDPSMIRTFIDAHQAERRADAKLRVAAERAMERAKAEIDRMSKALIAGRVDEDFFDREIVGLRHQLAESVARLEAAPESNVVTLHPAALAAMADTLDLLSKHLPTLDPVVDRDMFEAFRALIYKIVLHDKADGGVECEVIGVLSSLVGADAGDSWGGKVVARGRYMQFPPISLGRFAA